MNIKLTILSDSGCEINLTITKSNDDPIITGDYFYVEGNPNQIGGIAKFEHWEDRNLDRGLFFTTGEKAYIQCENYADTIQQAIDNLGK